jgi:hypothetical protein
MAYHDICDGCGALGWLRARLGIGQTVFCLALEMLLLLQHGPREGDISALAARLCHPQGGKQSLPVWALSSDMSLETDL